MLHHNSRTAKNMKHVITILAALALFAFGAQAQGNYQAASLLSTTASITAGATTNYNTVINVTKWDEIALQLSYKLAAATANNSNVTVTLSRSLDGVNWGTADKLVFTLAANSTNQVSTITNIDTGSIGYYRLDSIANANTNTMTNILVRFAVKPKRQG